MNCSVELNGIEKNKKEMKEIAGMPWEEIAKIHDLDEDKWKKILKKIRKRRHISPISPELNEKLQIESLLIHSD